MSTSSESSGSGSLRLEAIAPDLFLPPAVRATPAPGRRVVRILPDYEGTEIHHLLTLPEDWEPGRRDPVIVEYPGNRFGSSPGTVEGCALGYGVTAGVGALLLSLPFVDLELGVNATTWWGDVEATVDYCRKAVEEACSHFGGDPERLLVAGFSRGAIACSFIGLHDQGIASLWSGFICHSHYDGVREWPYPGSDRESALRRLARLGRRPVFVSHELSSAPGASLAATREFLLDAHPGGDFTFLELPFEDHTNAWVLRDLPERETLRRWYRRVIEFLF